MATYNDTNIKFFIDLIESTGGRTIENLIWRGGKKNIEEQEVVDAMELLMDLKVVTKEERMTGDGWNSRDMAMYYKLI
jgi:hypothetical protein